MCSGKAKKMLDRGKKTGVGQQLQTNKKGGHVSSIGCVSAWYADSRRFTPHIWQNILSLRFGHEIISTANFSLLLIQEGQLSVTGEIMGIKYW